MREFLIRPLHGGWFNLHQRQFSDALRPTTLPSQKIDGWGDHRIVVDGEEIAFSYEDPGIQVSFDTGKLDRTVCVQVIDEICDNIMRVTGQVTRVVEL